MIENITKREVIIAWGRIMRALGHPPIQLVFDAEWKRRTGYNLGAVWGRANIESRLVGIRFRGRDLVDIIDTLWHEAGHILFPSKPHWWIECYGNIMAGNDRLGRYSRRYNHSPADLPPRRELLALSIKKAAKLKPAAGCQGKAPAQVVEGKSMNQKKTDLTDKEKQAVRCNNFVLFPGEHVCYVKNCDLKNACKSALEFFLTPINREPKNKAPAQAMDDLDKMKLALQKAREAEEILETLDDKDDKDFIQGPGGLSVANLRYAITVYEIDELVSEGGEL